MKKEMTVLAFAAAVLSACSGSSELKLKENNIDEIIAAMTLEEKAQLIIGQGMPGVPMDAPVVGNTEDCAVPGAAGCTFAIPRLGIPSIVLADGPAGLRINPTREGDEATYYCTHFPIGTLLASSWDVDLVKSVGQAMGNEVLEYGADVLLAPAMNIHRNPLNGRNFEYYSEDPVVAGKIASAYIQGIQSQGVGTSLKHFAFNSQETNRMGNNSVMSERTAREIYLRGFSMAVRESQPWTVMSSYNYINGVYTSESRDLLTTVLRDEWGFKGAVMTDWFGGADGAAQVAAGNDMLQPGRQAQCQAVIDGVTNGTLSEEAVNTSVRRILELIVKSPTFKGYAYSNKPDLEAHAAVTRQSATEGMVLLENKGGLPLKDVKNVALFGTTGYSWIAGGTGSGDVNRAYTVSLLDGLKNAGYELNQECQTVYQEWAKAEEARMAAERPEGVAGLMYISSAQELDVNKVNVSSIMKDADVALIAIGRVSGEGGDRSTEDFELNATEKALIEKVCTAAHAVGKKAVVVLNIGGVIETASWKNLPDAVLCAWQAGQEGGNSVVDVLSGKANPSGKLTMTWPVSLMDHASSQNFPINMTSDMASSMMSATSKGKFEGTQNYDFTKYEEGIYVGYRWFDAQNKNVSYPFGYGLSYTNFMYAAGNVLKSGDNYTVEVTVTNSGSVAGKEVVELYVSAPKEGLDKPVQELKAFAKTPLLEPGKSAKVTLTVPASELSFYNEASSAWEVQPGTYTFKVGASSRDIRATSTIEVGASSTPAHKVFAERR